MGAQQQPAGVPGSRRTGILEFFSYESFDRLSGIMYPKRVKKGSALFREGDPARSLYYIRYGRVKVTKSTDDGSTLIFYLHNEGDLIGYGDCLAGAAHLFGAEAMEDCKLGVIRWSDLEVLLWQHGDLAVEFMRWQGTMHTVTQTKFRDLVMYGKQGALCSLLIRLSNTYGEPEDGGGTRIAIRLSNTEMADMIGATRESVNRMLGELKKRSVVDYDRGFVVVRDFDYLRDVCHCGNCPRSICRI